MNVQIWLSMSKISKNLTIVVQREEKSLIPVQLVAILNEKPFYAPFFSSFWILGNVFSNQNYKPIVLISPCSKPLKK